MENCFNVSLKNDNSSDSQTYEVTVNRKIRKELRRKLFRFWFPFYKTLIIGLIGWIFYVSKDFLYNTSLFTKSGFDLKLVFSVAYFLVFVVVISVLLIILKTDNCVLKFEKLAELNEIKCKLLDECKFNASDQKIEEGLDLYEHNGSWEKKNNSIITKKSECADLLKHYMTCVTEI